MNKREVKAFIRNQHRLYKVVYLVAWLRSLLYRITNPNSERYDLVFVNTETGWILEGICKEIERFCTCKTFFQHSLYDIPKSKAYFFSHYSSFVKAIHRSPWILNGHNVVFYTHHRYIGFSEEEVIYALNKANKLVVMNSKTSQQLERKGVSGDKLLTIIGGADKSVFSRREKGKSEYPCIGFCLRFSDRPIYTERKRYNTIIELIKCIDFATILLIGRDWEKYKYFNDIQKLSHFEYLNIPYSEYPEAYRRMDVFVSVSKLEGGPIPLLEAMMCDVFPVVSKTGFAPDVIQDGVNGFLFDVDSSVDEIVEKIKLALSMTCDVRKTVEDFSWENFSQKIQRAVADNSA